VIDASECVGSWTFQIQERIHAMAKRPEPLATVGTGGQAAKCGVQLAKFPVLKSMLCDLRYEEGDEVRMPSYLIIRPQGGAWHVTLKDPSTGLQLRVSVESYDLVHGALESLLSAPGCPWEVDPWAKPEGTRKKRRAS
jgi:hypothetical protein